MKVLMLYRPNSEHARKVEDFVRDFNRNYINYKLELVDLNTRDGAATASLYDVIRYPAMLALTNDGQVIHEWQGESIPPLMSEVSYYAQT
jgi:hypothetical protein